MMTVADFTLESAFSGSADTTALFILVTADNGGGTEGPLGSDSAGTDRTADTYCAQ